MLSFNKIITEPNLLMRKNVLEIFCEDFISLNSFRHNSPGYVFNANIYVKENSVNQTIKHSFDEFYKKLLNKSFNINFPLPAINYVVANDLIGFDIFKNIDILFSNNLSKYVDSKEEFFDVMNAALRCLSFGYGFSFLYFNNLESKIISRGFFHEYAELIKNDLTLDLNEMKFELSPLGISNVGNEYKSLEQIEVYDVAMSVRKKLTKLAK